MVNNMTDLEYDLDLAAEFGNGFMPESDDDGLDFEATAKNLSKMGYQKIVWHDTKKELPNRLKPVSEGGGDEPENLITLCKNCHKEIHREMNLKEEINNGKNT